MRGGDKTLPSSYSCAWGGRSVELEVLFVRGFGRVSAGGRVCGYVYVCVYVCLDDRIVSRWCEVAD